MTSICIMARRLSVATGIDVAVDIPFPDDDCRKRLIERFGHALNFQGEALAEAVSRSKGGSAAYIKEMVRRLAQRRITREAGSLVSREDVEVVFSLAESERSPSMGMRNWKKSHHRARRLRLLLTLARRPVLHAGTFPRCSCGKVLRADNRR
ncbi:hypothetical protein [Rhizobium leguminosarum]|uniref:hypothetical protein n=1 Tax=Rhizobium leguminosarum TaxID=384 RepID=UPI001C905073|nr:hypothetical protein [Rhizobium leguminosarum]